MELNDIVGADLLKLIEKKFLNKVIKKYSLKNSIIKLSNFTNIVFDQVDLVDTKIKNCIFKKTSFSKVKNDF